MTISIMTRALALSLLATTASAQTGYVPAAPAASVVDGTRIGDVAAAPSAVAPGRFGDANMLAALARVEPGLYTNNEMIRIDKARRSGDAETLRFYVSHDNRAVAGQGPTTPEARLEYVPVAPMGGRGPDK